MLILTLGFGCAATQGPDPSQASLVRHEYASVVMGSRARVVMYAPSEGAAAAAAKAAFDEMRRLNDILSDYSDSSEAMRLCAAPPNTPHPASPELIDILLKSHQVYDASNAAFDPTLGTLTHLWRDAFRAQRLPSDEALLSARQASGFHRLRLDPDASTITITAPGLLLDFGAIGKGYAADRALAILTDLGYPAALVDLGGDIAIGAPPPDADAWTIAITDDRSSAPRRVRLANKAVATSGDTYRSVVIDGVRYSHILNPATGLGLTSSHTVTVIADHAWLADALASAASVLGPLHSAPLTQRFPDAQFFWRPPSPESPRDRQSPSGAN